MTATRICFAFALGFVAFLPPLPSEARVDMCRKHKRMSLCNSVPNCEWVGNPDSGSCKWSDPVAYGPRPDFISELFGGPRVAKAPPRRPQS
jgi:hypothetical protein